MNYEAKAAGVPEALGWKALWRAEDANAPTDVWSAATAPAPDTIAGTAAWRALRSSLQKNVEDASEDASEDDGNKLPLDAILYTWVGSFCNNGNAS